MYKILVLGGYGNFGARIARSLCSHPNIQLVIAGRNIEKATALWKMLDNNSNHLAVAIDQHSSNFIDELAKLNVDCLIHTSGPYQGQGYGVAQACIATDTNYIDIADGREFVNTFGSLNDDAVANNLLLVSGASTLPGVSSAVVSKFMSEFKNLRSIHMCITPGNQAPRGKSTIAAVLSYCGQKIKCWKNGEWQDLYGWQDLHSHTFPKLGKRWLGVCEVPDLTLFHERYPSLKTIVFHAALETTISQIGFWLIACLIRVGLIRDSKTIVPIVYKIGEWLNFMGTPDGGMFVALKGTDSDNHEKELIWYLTALNGHGPEIPTIPAIILAKKLAEGKLKKIGAMPCFEMITLEEFDEAVSHLDISWETQRG